MANNNAVNRSGEVERFDNGQSFVAARLRLPLSVLQRRPAGVVPTDLWCINQRLSLT